ncbi:tautomerase family protein [Actinopolymorpha singaporensis]|uniref:Phenylpyruvate tautomerase PptA, 4-oxalocrotonate tautomerase family n=1 Tax=Actinopolymorpha singaporensis TaxID=117157 RepID=A0A1H1Q5A3_9ACTN|nr:tautomerase family protein [Actinopolymorpha singaporensis]SDS18554.1 Phenylpyruvate tautomerase PptA, 4-oxalocrotonate tautomerase family [Actinopolymorpha singaporensis]
MPMWHIYHPSGAYTAEEKKQFAARITGLYTDLLGLPRFYVNVAFNAFSAEDFFVGGEPHDRYVRIWIDHIARRTPDPSVRRWWMETINQTLAPFLRDRDLHWEIHVDETPFEFWTIDGYFPPAPESPDERRWAEQNGPSPLVGE